MANQRSKSQTQIAFSLDQRLLDALDSARPPGVSRSQWIREALAAELSRAGVPVSTDVIAPPDRAGKGGPKRKREVRSR